MDMIACHELGGAKDPHLEIVEQGLSRQFVRPS